MIRDAPGECIVGKMRVGEGHENTTDLAGSHCMSDDPPHNGPYSPPYRMCIE